MNLPPQMGQTSRARNYRTVGFTATDKIHRNRGARFLAAAISTPVIIRYKGARRKTGDVLNKVHQAIRDRGVISGAVKF